MLSKIRLPSLKDKLDSQEDELQDKPAKTKEVKNTEEEKQDEGSGEDKGIKVAKIRKNKVKKQDE